MCQSLNGERVCEGKKKIKRSQSKNIALNKLFKKVVNHALDSHDIHTDDIGGHLHGPQIYRPLA